ncbi:MAG: hypothetical protein D6743_00755 [Calditrichaeota bacterium]|nr:MAG: hypothetical protein D6743_00755 [Calditrichota bacterium]
MKLQHVLEQPAQLLQQRLTSTRENEQHRQKQECKAGKKGQEQPHNTQSKQDRHNHSFLLLEMLYLIS